MLHQVYSTNMSRYNISYTGLKVNVKRSKQHENVYLTRARLIYYVQFIVGGCSYNINVVSDKSKDIFRLGQLNQFVPEGAF